MAQNIHIEKNSIEVTCGGCSNKFTIESTFKDNKMHIEKCYKCHPAYTGIRKSFAARRVDKFNEKYKLNSKNK